MSNVYVDHAVGENAVKTSTPQSQPIPGREKEMKRNNAGGFTFTLDHWGVLDRFLMIGSEKAGYYVGQKETTKQSFDTAKKCIAEDGPRVVARLLEFSLAGRAPKNDPAVAVLAIAAVYGNDETKKLAYEALPRVARTGTWLFQFVAILDALGKWNAAAKRGVAAWYTQKTVDKMTVQMLKYQSRNGWSHRDVLRLAHIKPPNELVSNVFKYVTKGAEALEKGAAVPQLLVDFELLKRTDSAKEVIRLIEGSDLVTWEMVPTQFLKDKDVMMALLKNMGMTAVIRKLGILTANGVITPMSEGTKLVRAKLEDVEALKRGRVHPLTILQAMRQYSAGRGEKGSNFWTPNQQIVDALDDAFYAAFDAAEKTTENYMIACDISGSMHGASVNGSPNLVAADVAVVMAMAIARNQPNSWIVGYNTQLVDLKITSKMRLDAALKSYKSTHWDGGGTDCAKPFEYAQAHKIHVDKFVSITDNETWAGRSAPAQALVKYRQSSGVAAKSVVIGTSVSEFTIADPKDAGSLDIAGFDSAAPQLIANL